MQSKYRDLHSGPVRQQFRIFDQNNRQKIDVKRSEPRSNKYLWFFVKLAITLGLVVFVIYKVGLLDPDGRNLFWETLKGVDVFYLGISLGVGLIMNLLSSYKWQVLLLSRRIVVRLYRLFAIYYIGKFFNLFLPTGMGGDIARIYQLGRLTGTNTESLASVFIERFTGMITLTIVSLVAVLVSLREHDLPIITYSLAVCVFLISILIWLMLDRRPLALFSNLITGRFESLTPLIQKLARTHDAVRAYKDNLPTLWYTFAISLLFYFLAVINVWVSALAFSREVEFLTILVAVPAIMLIMNLPVSIGGLGLMEAAYTIIFTSFGYSSGLAVSTALLIRLKTLIDGVVGSIFYLAKPEPISESREAS